MIYDVSFLFRNWATMLLNQLISRHNEIDWVYFIFFIFHFFFKIQLDQREQKS